MRAWLTRDDVSTNDNGNARIWCDEKPELTLGGEYEGDEGFAIPLYVFRKMFGILPADASCREIELSIETVDD